MYEDAYLEEAYESSFGQDELDMSDNFDVDDELYGLGDQDYDDMIDGKVNPDIPVNVYPEPTEEDDLRFRREWLGLAD